MTSNAEDETRICVKNGLRASIRVLFQFEAVNVDEVTLSGGSVLTNVASPLRYSVRGDEMSRRHRPGK